MFQEEEEEEDEMMDSYDPNNNLMNSTSSNNPMMNSGDKDSSMNMSMQEEDDGAYEYYENNNQDEQESSVSAIDTYLAQKAQQERQYDEYASAYHPDDPTHQPAFYGYSENVGGSSLTGDKISSSGVKVPGSPLPADRLARKQRNFSRRGGFVHSTLLRSAVYACMSEEGGTTSTSTAPLTTSPPSAQKKNSSPRKRMRRTDRSTRVPPSASHSPPADDAVIARATDLLQKLCVQPLDGNDNTKSTATSSLRTRSGIHHRTSPPQRTRSIRRTTSSNSRTTTSSLSMMQQMQMQQMMMMSSRHSRDGSVDYDYNSNNHPIHEDFDRSAPIRRVSRRTSYASQISTGTDFDDDLDEFH